MTIAGLAVDQNIQFIEKSAMTPINVRRDEGPVPAKARKTPGAERQSPPCTFRETPYAGWMHIEGQEAILMSRLLFSANCLLRAGSGILRMLGDHMKGDDRV